MALEQSCNELHRRISALKSAVMDLDTFVRQSVDSTRHPSAPLDQLSDQVIELEAQAEKAMLAAERAVKSARYPTDAVAIRAALAVCQRCLNEFADKLFADVHSFDRIDRFMCFGEDREWEQDWRQLATAILKTQCSLLAPLASAWSSICACWEDVADRSGPVGVSVNTTNIGQQVSGVRAEELADAAMT